MSEVDKERMISINKEQAVFYGDSTNDQNLIHRFWAHLRSEGFGKFRRELGVDMHYVDLHKEWLGDLSAKSVLDLGCGGGNVLSLYLAAQARAYVAIDLSGPSLQCLEAELAKAGIKDGEIICGDFLDHDWQGKKFDVIYAFSVVHHFANLEVLIEALLQRLAPGGIVITYDPVSIRLLSRLVRGLYRPFQPDAAWEYPFSKKSIELISRNFRVLQSQGYMGRSTKYFAPYFLFGRKNAILKMAHKAHDKDMNELKFGSPKLYSSMHVSFLLARLQD